MTKNNKLIAQSINIGSIEPITDSRQPENLESATVLSTLELWISDIIGIITVLATLFFIVYAFIAAFNWITAAGDKSKIEKAKDRLVWSTLGLILIVASYAIIGLIGGIIGLELLQPAKMIEQLIPVSSP
jgi:polyferredoxin